MAIVDLPSASNALYQTTSESSVLVRKGIYRISTTNDAIRMNHYSSSLAVHGEVYGGDDAVQVDAALIEINVGKTGVISALQDYADDKCGIDIASGANSAYIYNSGRISGYFAVDGRDAAALEIHNFGEIHGSFKSILNARFVVNSGIIRGTIELEDDNNPNVNFFKNELWNRGEIYGNVQGSGEYDWVINSGTIYGDVNLGSLKDLYDGRGGVVTGKIVGGPGDDTYIIDDASTPIQENYAHEGDDKVFSSVSFKLPRFFEYLFLQGADNLSGIGNDDVNSISGNSGNNRLAGLDGRDRLYGFAGDDKLLGGNHGDRLVGGNGHDQLFGGMGNDTLFGDRGRDVLFGGGGNDVLRGGLGRDQLSGGLGSDELRGEGGRDTFKFIRAKDSPNSAARDTIIGFVSGEDAVDLSDLTSTRLDLAIGGTFSGQGPSVRTVVKNGDTRILVDTDGDKTAEMRIDLVAVTVIDEGDFIL